MTAVTLHDTLIISRNRTGEIRFTWRWAGGIESQRTVLALHGHDAALGSLPCDHEKNIVWRAAELLRRSAAVMEGASIHLVKRIPTESGLGGASSDAAATIRGLNRVWRLGWPESRLAELGSELGSDVPFFLQAGRSGSDTAICRGRGENVQPVPGIPRLHFVIVRPREGLATAAVYQRCRPAAERSTPDALLQALRCGNGRSLGALLFNRLEFAAQSLCPWVKEMRQAFSRFDCLGHQMSGSGSSYFGICRNARHARRVAELVRAAGLGQVFLAETASRESAAISA